MLGRMERTKIARNHVVNLLSLTCFGNSEYFLAKYAGSVRFTGIFSRDD